MTGGNTNHYTTADLFVILNEKSSKGVQCTVERVQCTIKIFDLGLSMRQRDRVVKVMDSKSIGLCPQGFESPRCRSFLVSRGESVCIYAWQGEEKWKCIEEMHTRCRSK